MEETKQTFCPQCGNAKFYDVQIPVGGFMLNKKQEFIKYPTCTNCGWRYPEPVFLKGETITITLKFNHVNNKISRTQRKPKGKRGTQ